MTESESKSDKALGLNPPRDPALVKILWILVLAGMGFVFGYLMLHPVP